MAGKYRVALSFFKEALFLYQNFDIETGIVDSYNNIGISYDYLGVYDLSLIAHFKSLEVAEEIQDTFAIARSNNNIGIIFLMQGENKNAAKYFEQAYRLRKQLGDDYGVASSLVN